MVCFLLIFNFSYHISEVEINIARRRGALDNCNIKWSNTVNWLPTIFIFLYTQILNVITTISSVCNSSYNDVIYLLLL